MNILCPALLAVLGSLLLLGSPANGATYHIDADGGNDTNAGTSPATAWATLTRASTQAYQPGDQILLQAGDTFTGKLRLENKAGSAGLPIVIASYGTGAKPVIHAAGRLAGVHLRDCRYIEVRDLEITANGGATVDGSASASRYGVYVDATSGKSVNFITIDGLFIHDIYPETATASEGANPTTFMGSGVVVNGLDRAASGNIVVRDCLIERVGFKAIELKFVSVVDVLDNVMNDIGGPAIQPSRVDDLVVRGNVVNRSGSYLDPRMHGRGSGIWPWACERVLIEKNRFMNAVGRGDSCGIHIDFNNRDVVVQYNLSVNNSGGFIEILGNNFNCTYRYNISINDGWRKRGVVDHGTLPNDSNGFILFISGYVGGNPPQGPTNSYLYNNTIYVKSGLNAAFNIQHTALGLLVANNIFYVVPTTKNDTPTSLDNYTQNMVDRVVWRNNLYQRTGILPVFTNAPYSFTETSAHYGNPRFATVGGLLPENYIPGATALVVDKGIVIPKLPGDTVGLRVGLAVTQDFFGNPVVGLPDMGAIELPNTPQPLPDATFARNPAYAIPDTAVMEAVAAPAGTEYYFAEVSGNHGGHDSGWQTEPVYRDKGLLPNTTYAYTVTLRNSLQQAGAPSASRPVATPARSSFAEPVLLSESFSTALNPANAAAPFPAKTLFVAYEEEAQADSTIVAGGLLRTAWGYDRTILLWYSDRHWNPAYGCRFGGDWKIDAVLDEHLGLIVGLGEFDPVSGELLRRIKEATVGDLVTPVVGETGTFSLEVSPAELAASGIDSSNRIGLFIEHLGAATPERNDVYSVDNLTLTQLGVQPDTDGDGIPDATETLLGLNPGNAADGSADPDGDQWSNYKEVLAGTGINSPSGAFRLSISAAAGGAQVRIPGANLLPGRLYILERSANLLTWTAVAAVSGSLVESGTDQVLQVPMPGLFDFYRVRVAWE